MVGDIKAAAEQAAAAAAQKAEAERQKQAELEAQQAEKQKLANKAKEEARQRRILKNRDVLNTQLARLDRVRRRKTQDVSHRKHRGNYILTHRFYVEMGGIIRAAFNECSGFGLDIKKELYLEGGVNEQQRVMLGHAEFQDTVLKRGMTNDVSFWAWMKETLVGRSLPGSTAPLARTRRNINILMMNQGGQIMQICTLIGAIPIGWKAPAFQASEAAVAIEEITLSYEGIDLKFEGNEKLGAGGATAFLLRDSLGFFPER